MSMHPLQIHMMVVEVAVTVGAIGGGVALHDRGHPLLAAAAWTGAGLVGVALAAMAVSERKYVPPADVLRNLAISLGMLGVLSPIGWAAWAIAKRGHPLWGVAAFFAGIVLLALVALGIAYRLETRRERHEREHRSDDPPRE